MAAGGAAKRWVRHRFHANGEDSRPVRFPPPGPWWESGFAFDESYSIVIAYLPEGEAVTEWWPEATEIDSAEPVDRITYTERFPKPEWWKGE